MVVILCPPPPLFLVPHAASVVLLLLQEIRLKFQSRDQDCLGARYVVHLWCTVHSVNSEIRTASKPEMLFTCGAQYIHVVLLSCFLSSPGITDRERSAGSALTSCTVTVHSLPHYVATAQIQSLLESWRYSFSTVVLFLFVFFLLSPSLWLCCYFLVVVGDGDSRWLLGTLAHWCACQTARQRTTVSQPPSPPLITISAYPQLQAVLGLVGGLVL